ncbi:MAG: transcriptional initiation protein Tat [Burkholderiaceae bacterium]|nr:transcriptional initiation protein Tat [Burkholderiaceae bacterium]
MKKNESAPIDTPRRRALRELAATPALAAVALAATRAEAAATPDKPAHEAASRGYHETDHIRDYYRTAGL